MKTPDDAVELSGCSGNRVGKYRMNKITTRPEVDFCLPIVGIAGFDRWIAVPSLTTNG